MERNGEDLSGFFMFFWGMIDMERHMFGNVEHSESFWIFEASFFYIVTFWQLLHIHLIDSLNIKNSKWCIHFLKTTKNESSFPSAFLILKTISFRPPKKRKLQFILVKHVQSERNSDFSRCQPAHGKSFEAKKNPKKILMLANVWKMLENCWENTQHKT